MSPLQGLCIIIIGLLAGFYGAAAGGAAARGVPGLLLLGVPPSGAVAAAHVGALGMYASGGYRYRRAGLLAARPLLPLLGWVALGALIGALLIQRLDTERLQPVILALAVLMALLVLLGPRLGLERPCAAPSPGRRRAGYALAVLVGVYAAAVIVAWATLLTVLLVGVFGVGLVQSAAARMLLGTAVSGVATVVYAAGGTLPVMPSLLLCAGMAAGSYLGASVSLRQGSGYIRALIVLVTLASVLRPLL